MTQINRVMQRIFAFGAGLSMSLVFLIIFVNALRRYTIGRSVPWGEELPIYLTIYGVMFGLAWAYMQDRHIRFTILTDMLPEGLRQRLFLLVDLVTVASGVALAIAGHEYATRRGGIASSGLKSTGAWLAETFHQPWMEWFGKVGTWQYAIAIGGAMLAAAALIRFFTRLSEIRAAVQVERSA